MKPYLLVTTLVGLVLVAAAAPQQDNPFVKEGVVPDVIDVAPPAKIEVVYNDNLKVQYGNELTPTQVQALPKVSWPLEADALYTVAMVDPDAPSRSNPASREFLHFLIGNVPSTDISEADPLRTDTSEKGDTLAPYIGSGPPKGSGLHRYVWLVYKQPGRINFNFTPVSDRSFTGRPKFSIRKFAAEHKLGSPVAGNFFQAQYDDYVPTLYAKVKMNVTKELQSTKSGGQ